MARPRKNPHEKKGQFIGFWATLDELAKIDIKQRLLRCDSRSDYLRQAALMGTINVVERRGLAPEIVHQLKRIGANLNQMTRLYNARTDAPPPVDLQPMLATLQEIVFREIIPRED